MKITFPHMGNIWISIDAMFNYLNVETVIPPYSSKKTLSLGIRHAPEFACLPFKLNLGNFIEAYELGADAIMMAGGCGPCRFGYYAQVQMLILQDLGYNYKMLVLEPPERHFSQFLARIRQLTGRKSWWQVVKAIYFGYLKAKAIDELEMLAYRKRPREVVQGDTDRALKKALTLVQKAGSPKALAAALEEGKKIVNQIPVEIKQKVMKIGLVGEIYTLLEPFVNFNIDSQLGRLGVEVDRSIYLSEWVNDHIFMGLMKGMRSSRESLQAACPYLNHKVGGHGQQTIGSTVLYAQDGYDGVIQLLPLTCMPEIVAEAILPGVSTAMGIPVLTLIVDEHSGEAGIVTRLEAFVDLLAYNKEKRKVYR